MFVSKIKEELNDAYPLLRNNCRVKIDDTVKD
jgi:hypothetical protein